MRAWLGAASATLLELPALALHFEFAHWEIADTECVAEAGGDFFKFHDALGFRFLVDAIDTWHELFEMGGDALVGSEHELFDEAVRRVALGAHDGAHVALRVELDHGFRQIEVDRAALDAFRVEDTRQRVHALEV